LKPYLDLILGQLAHPPQAEVVKAAQDIGDLVVSKRISPKMANYWLVFSTLDPDGLAFHKLVDQIQYAKGYHLIEPLLRQIGDARAAHVCEKVGRWQWYVRPLSEKGPVRATMFDSEGAVGHFDAVDMRRAICSLWEEYGILKLIGTWGEEALPDKESYPLTHLAAARN
jgi:hypothetical protein